MHNAIAIAEVKKLAAEIPAEIRNLKGRDDSAKILADNSAGYAEEIKDEITLEKEQREAKRLAMKLLIKPKVRPLAETMHRTEFAHKRAMVNACRRIRRHPREREVTVEKGWKLLEENPPDDDGWRFVLGIFKLAAGRHRTDAGQAIIKINKKCKGMHKPGDFTSDKDLITGWIEYRDRKDG
jgi:hypothetical protein